MRCDSLQIPGAASISEGARAAQHPAARGVVSAAARGGALSADVDAGTAAVAAADDGGARAEEHRADALCQRARRGARADAQFPLAQGSMPSCLTLEFSIALT